MSFYDNYLKVEPTRPGDWIQRRRSEAEWHMIRSHVAGTGYFLEIGPGHGVMAEVVLDSGLDYLAVESNMHIARSVYGSGFKVCRALIPPLPVCSQCISVVYAAHLIEHLADPNTALLFAHEARRVLTDDGLLFISAPDIRSFGGNFWDADYTHSFPVTRRRLQQLLFDAGFQIMKTVYFSGPIKGPASGLLSFIARFIPSELFIFPERMGERLTRLRLTFMRNISVLARKR
jgi:SAM-dependent methyltransferase